MDAKELALATWREQIAMGLGYQGEVADPAHLDDWLGNRTYQLELLQRAVDGDIAALVQVRAEAGLTVFN